MTVLQFLLSRLRPWVRRARFQSTSPTAMSWVSAGMASSFWKSKHTPIVGTPARPSVAQQSVIVSFPPPEAVAVPVESHSRNNGKVYAAVIGERCAGRFVDIERPAPHVAAAGINAQLEFAVAHHYGQEYAFTPLPTTDKGMCVHLVGQGAVEQNGMCRPEKRVAFQTAHYRY